MTNRERENISKLVEQKILEFFGDPDHGLQLKKSFVDDIRKRTKKKQVLINHSVVEKKYGLR